MSVSDCRLPPAGRTGPSGRPPIGSSLRRRETGAGIRRHWITWKEKLIRNDSSSGQPLLYLLYPEHMLLLCVVRGNLYTGTG